MMDKEHLEELEILKSNLCEIREKFLNEWTGVSYQKLFTVKKQQASDCVKERQENMKDLEDSIESDRNKLARLGQDSSEKEKVISSLERELDMLNLKTEQLKKEKLLREKQLDDAKRQKTHELQVVQKAREKTGLRMKQFTKGISFFQEYLGFNFKKVNDDYLQFVIKYIDPNDHDAAFTFTVKIDETGTYSIKDCTPMIGQLGSLTDELNKTNDFSKFVICVRQSFKELVRQV